MVPTGKIVIVESNTEKAGQAGSELLSDCAPHRYFADLRKTSCLRAGVGNKNVVVRRNNQPARL